MNIGDIFFSLRADGKTLQADVQKEGDKAAATLGQRVRGGVSTAFKAGLVGLGAAGGALFGIAARGGGELTAAVAAYRAETGATEVEAQQAQATISELYKNNTAGFETLGQVLTSVKVNLGLTGDAAATAAQKVLDYAKATGQDAVAAVGTLDDLTDTFNLDAAGQAAILDKLVLSHQRYGGSVEDNQAALVKLGPALTAANLSYDDGIGLLNLFAASGIDAATAPTALTKALSKVKSPEELQQLIDDISATTDPFERAAKATELFGTKAGPQLAQALGKGNLSDFTVSMEDATGAVDAASAAIDASPLNQLQLALKKISGPLADLGTQFGPVILGFSQLGGGKLISLVTTSLGGLAGAIVPLLGGLLPALGGVVTGIGSALGGLLAAAIPIGMALLPVLLIGALIAAIAFLVMNPDIVNKALEIGAKIVGAILDGLGALVGALLDIGGKIIGAIAGFVVQIVQLWLSIPVRAASAFLDLLAGVARFVGSAIPKILAFVGQVISAILSIPGKAIAWIGNLISGAARAAGGFVGKIVGLAGEVISTLIGIPGKVIGAVVDGFANIARQAVDAFLGLIGDIPGKVMGILGDIGDFIGGLIPKFAAGALEIPHDMLAILHKGEMVVPAAEAEAIRQGRSGFDAGARAAPATGGGDTHIHLQTYGLPSRAETPLEVAQQLRRAVRLGMVSPKRSVAWRPSGG